LKTWIAELVGRLNNGLVEEGRVVATVGIHSNEFHSMRSRRNHEGTRRVEVVTGAVGSERSHHTAVYFHLKRLAAGLIGSLGRIEADGVRAGTEAHRLADRAGCLKEGYLSTLRRGGIAAGKATLVPGHAATVRRTVAKRPGRTARIVSEIIVCAGSYIGSLEPRIVELVRDDCLRHREDRGGIDAGT